MLNRYISLYYGSVGKLRALVAVADWLAGCFVPAAVRRGQLAQAVRAHLGNVDVFALGSARSALTACLKAAGVGAGDEVLVSAYTCLAVPTGVIAVGARPVYMDIDPGTLNVDAASVSAALSPRVKAIIVQHTLGKVAPIEVIVTEARRRGILVIEDCALSVGSSLEGRQVGTFGDAAIFSMELSKTLSCGWGGILVVNDGKLATAVTRLYHLLPERGVWASTRDLWQTVVSAWCYRPALYALPGKYILFLGFRSGLFRSSTPKPEYEGKVAADFMVRMAGPQAALASRQWRDLSAIAAACERNAQQLRAVLEELRMTHPGAPETREVSIAPRVSFLVNNRQEALAYFRAAGVELGSWFDGPMSPVPSAPVFNYKVGSFPNAEGVARGIVNLPCHSRIDAADLARITTTLRDFVRERLAAH